MDAILATGRISSFRRFELSPSALVAGICSRRTSDTISEGQMTYQVASTEIAITYFKVSYVVTLTAANDPASFRIKSPVDGSFQTVDTATAAHLFGARSTGGAWHVGRNGEAITPSLLGLAQ